MFEKLQGFFSNSNNKDHESTKFLTGIRGYASLAVLLIHSGGAGLRSLGSVGNLIVDFGKYGVIVFFVLSAFTIMSSISNNKNFNYFQYLIRRLFRILPLYFSIIFFVVFILNGSQINQDLFRNFLKVISFYNLLDLGSRNQILNVEWTIPIEVFFYIVIPFIYLYISRANNIVYKQFTRIANIVLIGGIISLISIKYTILPYFNFSELQLALMYSVERYAFSYAVGIALFYIIKNIKDIKSIMTNSATLFLLLMSLLIYLIFFSQNGFANIVFTTLWTALLIIICYGGNKLSKILFNNRVIQYLGLISYSMYLIHMPVLNYIVEDNLLLKFVICLVITVILSTFTYYLIELPAIKLGKKLVK